MAAIHVAALLSHPAVRNAIERALAARGVRGDTMIAHIDPREAAMLRFMGGVGTVNPRTGLRQFYDPDAPGHDTPGVSGGGYSGGGTDNSGLGQGVSGQGGSGGSGLGAGGGHSGEGGYWSTGGSYNRPSPTAPYVAPTPINNMPPAAPVTLDPMMSSTATTDLTGGRFGALPSWATTPYQIGMAPSSYPTPGVNAARGAPGGGGGGLPGGGGGLPGGTGGGVTPIGTPIGLPGGGTQQPVVRTPGGIGVQLPGGNTVALLGYGGMTPRLPNGQTLQQYLSALRLGLQPRFPGAPTGLMGPQG